MCFCVHCKLVFAFSVVQLLNHVQLFVAPWTASLSFTNSWGLLRLMSIESMMPYNHLILCCPLLPPSIFPSIRVFPNELALCSRWPKYWSFSFSISPSNGYSRLLSFRIDWFDSLQSKDHSCSPTPQFEGINLWHSVCFTVQLSHPYITTGKPKF